MVKWLISRHYQTRRWACKADAGRRSMAWFQRVDECASRRGGCGAGPAANLPSNRRLRASKTKRFRSNSLLVYDNLKVLCFNSKGFWLKNNGISGGGKGFCHKRQCLCLNLKVLWDNLKGFCSGLQGLPDNLKGRRPGHNVLLQLERLLDQMESPLRQLERPFHQLERLFQQNRSQLAVKRGCFGPSCSEI